MSRNYTITTKILRPVAEVFAALVDREQMARYFTDCGSSDLVPGAQVTWTWDAWGDFPVVVTAVETNRRIELTLDSKMWRKTTQENYAVVVCFELEATEDDHTLLTISESGWRTDAEGLKGSHDNCGGWMRMSMCLKGYLEHNLDLR